MAAASPIQGPVTSLPRDETATPAKAEISMVPSSPMLAHPARSEIMAPKAARRMGVEIRKMEAAKVALKMESKMVSSIGARLLCHCVPNHHLVAVGS